MYWRIRNVTPENFLKQNALPIALGISLLLNLVLVITRPNPSQHLDKQTREQFTQFARDVTCHLLDSSYTTYQQSMAALATELAPSVIGRLRQSQQIAASTEEMQATLQTLERDKQISSVRMDFVEQSDPNSQGLVPIEVRGIAATHAADGAQGPTPFHFRFLMGTNKNTQQPIVAAFSE